jgi:hypothetical protein
MRSPSEAPYAVFHVVTVGSWLLFAFAAVTHRRSWRRSRLATRDRDGAPRGG